MYFCRLDGLFVTQSGQNRGEAPGEHGFARTGRPDHEDIVPAACRDLKDPLCLGLSLNVREIEIVDLLTHIIGPLCVDEPFHVPIPFEKVDNVKQMGGAVYVDALYNGCFSAVFMGHNNVFYPLFLGEHRDRKHPVDALDSSVERKFAGYEVILYDLLFHDIH